MRKAKPKKRIILPDPKFGDVKVSKFVNHLMYDGKKCSVFTRTGVHRFEGELNSNILEMFPMTGINKYIVMSENGMEIVRFVK